MRKFLLAEDDSDQLVLLKSILLKQYVDAEIKEATDGNQAIKILEEYKPDVLLTDYYMPKSEGDEVAAWAKELYPDCKVVLVSSVAYMHEENPDIDFIINKPFTSTDLLKVMITALN